MDDFWRRSEVQVRGDPRGQQCLHWNLFQLCQATSRAEGAGVGARGLTGQTYEGHYFWDTEIYIQEVEILEIVAILACSIFAGAAIYITVAEHPARLACGTEIAATVFGPSYKRAAVMQASLALVATLAGVMVALNGGSRLWLVGAGLIFFVVPFTFLGIMPTNTQLLDPARDRTSDETQALLETWGRLHAIRSVASLAASILYVYLGVAA